MRKKTILCRLILKHIRVSHLFSLCATCAMFLNKLCMPTRATLNFAVTNLQNGRRY
jgi:hypothetical protein